MFYIRTDQAQNRTLVRQQLRMEPQTEDVWIGDAGDIIVGDIIGAPEASTGIYEWAGSVAEYLDAITD